MSSQKGLAGVCAGTRAADAAVWGRFDPADGAGDSGVADAPADRSGAPQQGQDSLRQVPRVAPQAVQSME
jgi:hypothetical protein